MGGYNIHCFPMHKKYRSHMEIAASILESVNSGATHGLIIKQASTSSAQVKRYLESLVALNLIEMNIKDGRILYKASEKGLAFLRQYYVLQDMLLNSVGNNPDNTILATKYSLSNGDMQPSNLLCRRVVRLVRRS